MTAKENIKIAPTDVLVRTLTLKEKGHEYTNKVDSMIADKPSTFDVMEFSIKTNPVSERERSEFTSQLEEIDNWLRVSKGNYTNKISQIMKRTTASLNDMKILVSVPYKAIASKERKFYGEVGKRYTMQLKTISSNFFNRDKNLILYRFEDGGKSYEFILYSKKNYSKITTLSFEVKEHKIFNESKVTVIHKVRKS